jgi:hypothetical protein
VSLGVSVPTAAVGDDHEAVVGVGGVPESRSLSQQVPSRERSHRAKIHRPWRRNHGSPFEAGVGRVSASERFAVRCPSAV